MAFTDSEKKQVDWILQKILAKKSTSRACQAPGGSQLRNKKPVSGDFSASSFLERSISDGARVYSKSHICQEIR